MGAVAAEHGNIKQHVQQIQKRLIKCEPVAIISAHQNLNPIGYGQIGETVKETDVGGDLVDFTIVGRAQIPDRRNAHKKADSQLKNLVDQYPGRIVQKPVHLCHG